MICKPPSYSDADKLFEKLLDSIQGDVGKSFDRETRNISYQAHHNMEALPSSEIHMSMDEVYFK